MAWDTELGRELTTEEELARLRVNPTSVAQAVLEHEARTGQRSPLRDHPEVSGEHTLPEINVYSNEPDVIAVEDKPSASVPNKVPEQGSATAADILKVLESEHVTQPPVESDRAAELKSLLHNTEQNEARRIDTGLKPVWPPTPVPTGAQLQSLPAEQRPKTMADLLKRSQGIDPGQSAEFDARTTDPLRQAAQGAIGATLAAPWTVAGGLTALPEYGMRKAGIIDENTPSPTAYSMGRAQNAQDLATNLTGAKENPEGFGKVANTTGSSITPAGKFTAPITAGLSAMRLGVDEFAPRAEAAEALPKPGVTHTVESIGGPAKIKDSELLTLGGLAAVTLGAVFAPTIFSKLKYTKLPVFRPVKDAAPGTVTNSTLVDLARTFDDENAGVIRMARNAGVDPIASKKLQDTFQIHTGATAQTIANSAVQNGRSEVPGFVFKTDVPLAKLNQTMTKPTEDYIHARNSLEELLQRKQKPGAVAGPPTVRGMTENDLLAHIWALEQANPGVQNAAKVYADNLQALRKFESGGEYATKSIKNIRYMNASHKHEVPGIVTEDPNFEPGNPVESLAKQMVIRIRARVENEARGQYIDEVRKVRADMFTKVTTDQFSSNPNWQANTVKMYRRGKPEYYTTDPFIADRLKMDPYSFKSPLMNGLFTLKRSFEITTTGGLAPWFAPTSALRNWLISKHTAPLAPDAIVDYSKPISEQFKTMAKGFRIGDKTASSSPSLSGTAYAVPQQLIPQLAARISESLDKGNMGWLTHVIGKPAIDATSRWMANAYANSLYARIQSLGTHNNSLMEQQAQAQSMMAKALQEGKGTAFDLLRGYNNTLSAIHNAPAFAYISKNSTPSILERVRSMSHTMPMPMNELAMEARNLTGDPHIGGRYLNAEGKPIRFQTDNKIGLGLTRAYGIASEYGREGVPWFNQTEQGAKRLGKAYLDNPAKFVNRFWLYSMLPAAGGYLFARSLGNDPNGLNYVDYMMNRRSEYAKTMYYYIPNPWRPAEEGMEWPRFHEGSIMARMMEAGLDHMYRSAVFTEKEDLQHAAASFFNVAIDPPLPPVINMFYATQGIAGAQGVFGGEGYTRKSDPFDQTAGMASNTELLVRSLVPGIGEIGGAGWAAMTQTPDGADKAMKNMFKEMTKRMAIKTPILRDIANLHTPISGNTEISSELFRKQKSIDQLVRYYQTYDNPTGPGGGVHEINTKPVSKSGIITAEKLLGPQVSSQNPGLDQPPPTNPLYSQFMNELYLKVHKDSEKTGGEGFKSLWDYYRDASDAITKMRNINAGNFVTWQQQMNERNDLVKGFEEAGPWNVDPKAKSKAMSHNRNDLAMQLDNAGVNRNDPYAVRNFYEKKRQWAARTILFYIRDVEDRMSKVAGKPIKIEDLQPYGTGGEKQYTAPTEFSPYGAAVQ